jgi:hypothetical protein
MLIQRQVARWLFTFVLTFVSLNAESRAEGGDAALLARLPTSKHNLVEGLQAASAEGAVPISAKLEFEDGKLWLSVYGAKRGLSVDAEHNELFELKGDATAVRWQPVREVFQDREHLARAAGQLTLLQTTSLTLGATLVETTAQKRGTVYSITPVLKNGKTALLLLVRTNNGQSERIVVEEPNQ